MLQSRGSPLERLSQSPWPLSLSDVALLLDTDEITAAKVLRILREAGKATLNGERWVIRP